MRVSLKLATAVIGGAALVSAASVAVASTVTPTTHPVTLCIGKLGGNVTAPATNQPCSRLQTSVQLASNSDLQAVLTRIQSDEASQASDHAQIAALTSGQYAGNLTITTSGSIKGEYSFLVTGSHLIPGSAIENHEGGSPANQLGVADSNGDFSSSSGASCEIPLYVTGTNIFGVTVTSNSVGPFPPGC